MGIDDDEAREFLVEDEEKIVPLNHPRTRLCISSLMIPWILSAFFFCTTVYYALQSSQTCSSELSSYEIGFNTDFASSDPPVPMRLVQKHFTNDLLYNTTSGTFYNQPLDPNEVSYIGSSPSIELAWHNLLHAQYIALSMQEAKQFPPGHISPVWYDGERNFMELSVFHNLHCLNEIRVALSAPHPEEGGSTEGEKHSGWLHGGGNGRVHLDHCVDQIRQALMCHADLTPVPMKPAEGVEGAIIGNGEMHTCRDFDAIWGWVEGRSKRWKSFGD